MQNNVDERKRMNPSWKIVGTEETTGCGTRGVYFNTEPYHMVAMNRDTTHHHVENVIERGWQFYADRPWAAGIFYWTGFDYRGEPNPLSYPATDSEFGILDYCGFWKDEAWYLRSWWTNEPTLHVFPHWNLTGHEGEEIELWAYSNCDEVELTVNGKRMGRQAMPPGGHLKWKAVYQPGKVVATGYKNGRRILTETISTTKPAAKIVLKADRYVINADGRDVAVVTAEVHDSKGRIVPDACPQLTFHIKGDAHIIGAGNGDPAYLGADHPQDINCKEFQMPAFNGLAQVLIQSGHEASTLTLTATADGLTMGTLTVSSK
jgi:beta-galactosidase